MSSSTEIEMTDAENTTNNANATEKKAEKIVDLADCPKVKFTTSDEKEFTVARPVAEMSVTIKNMLADLEVSDQAIPLLNVNSETFQKIVNYCEHHYYHPEVSTDPNHSPASKRCDDMVPWDESFIEMEQPQLFEIILASNYLDIKNLLDLSCKKVASMIKGKSPEEIRKTFNIKNDFTPEEEEQVRRENAWCEER